jgi:hypothetical protein
LLRSYDAEVRRLRADLAAATQKEDPMAAGFTKIGVLTWTNAYLKAENERLRAENASLVRRRSAMEAHVSAVQARANHLQGLVDALAHADSLPGPNETSTQWHVAYGALLAMATTKEDDR